MLGHWRRPARAARASAWFVAIVMAAALAGCGSGSSKRTSTHAPQASVCIAKARAAIAAFLGIGEAKVAASPTISSQDQPTCNFSVPLAGGKTARLSVMDEVTSQSYFLLERTIDEAAQMFAPVRLSPAPEQVPNLGLDASWFPAENYVMTTDGVRLITATVEWPSAPRARQRALAAAVARTYLGPLDWKAADPAGS